MAGAAPFTKLTSPELMHLRKPDFGAVKKGNILAIGLTKQ